MMMIEWAFLILVFLVVVIVLFINGCLRDISQRLDDMEEELLLQIKKNNENKDRIDSHSKDIQALCNQLCNYRDVYVRDLLHPWNKNK